MKYGEDYLTWKEWDQAQSFGRIEAADRVYYAAELGRTGLQRVESVLELGFGSGGFLAYCRERGWRCVGTEVNPGLLAMARSAGFQAVAAEELGGLDAASFDLVAAFDVLEHIEQEAIVPLLASIRRCLRPGGVLLARFPNGDSPFGLSLQHGDVTHLTTLGSGKLEYFAKVAGFELLRIGGPAQPIFTGRVSATVRRVLVVPVMRCLEFIIRRIFFPGTSVTFLTPSLVVCLRRPLEP